MWIFNHQFFIFFVYQRWWVTIYILSVIDIESIDSWKCSKNLFAVSIEQCVCYITRVDEMKKKNIFLYTIFSGWRRSEIGTGRETFERSNKIDLETLSATGSTWTSGCSDTRSDVGTGHETFIFHVHDEFQGDQSLRAIQVSYRARTIRIGSHAGANQSPCEYDPYTGYNVWKFKREFRKIVMVLIVF